VVSAERVFELARHLTERDREIARRLYDQQVLTTDQLTLLFFSSTRRAQDRLLFLYRERVVDRFYPVSRFGAGKPQAHWLLDEAGALLVAAMRGVDRKQLGWQRREDWGSHPQLVHRPSGARDHSAASGSGSTARASRSPPCQHFRRGATSPEATSSSPLAAAGATNAPTSGNGSPRSGARSQQKRQTTRTRQKPGRANARRHW
jgi:hypothetical protein